MKPNIKVPDRAKARREYLVKKAKTNTQRIFGALITIFFGLLTVVFAIGMVFCLVRTDGPSIVWVLLLALLTGSATYLGYRFVYDANVEDKSIECVPPVHEQIPHLPAEEVLLRGSQASAASPDELLRSAAKQETPAEELLRATEDETVEQWRK